LESEQQKGDMEWQEEESSEGVLSHTQIRKKGDAEGSWQHGRSSPGSEQVLKKDQQEDRGNEDRVLA
jgi:hypothetical protein